MKVTSQVAEMASIMRADLEGRRLRVTLGWYGFGYEGVRVVDEQNPVWYQEFCATYSPSKRARPRQRKKPDTYIKRSHTIRALGEIGTGKADSLYAQRLVPFIEREMARLPKNGWTIE